MTLISPKDLQHSSISQVIDQDNDVDGACSILEVFGTAASHLNSMTFSELPFAAGRFALRNRCCSAL